MSSGLASPILGCLPPCPLSLFLGHHVVLSPLCLSSVGAWGGACLSCRHAVRCGLSLVARSPCRLAERRSGWLLACVSRLGAQFGLRVALRSSSRYSVQAADCLPCGGRPDNRRGRRDGVRLPSSAYLDEAGGECVDCVNCRFSVDYFGAGGYINTRALIGFSFRCFLARACCAGGSMVLRPHRSRSMPPLIGSSGARRERFFFTDFHLIPSHPSATCLRICFLLPGYHHIHIAPLLAPLLSTRGTGRLMAAMRMAEAAILLASCGDGR